MDLNWVPEALTQLNQYPSDRFWGVLVFSALVIVVCTWLVARRRSEFKKEGD